MWGARFLVLEDLLWTLASLNSLMIIIITIIVTITWTVWIPAWVNILIKISDEKRYFVQKIAENFDICSAIFSQNAFFSIHIYSVEKYSPLIPRRHLANWLSDPSLEHHHHYRHYYHHHHTCSRGIHPRHHHHPSHHVSSHWGSCILGSEDYPDPDPDQPSPRIRCQWRHCSTVQYSRSVQLIIYIQYSTIQCSQYSQ